MTARSDEPRVLVLCPFPPDPMSAHGGGRLCGQFITELSARVAVGLVYLRRHDEPRIPDALRRLVDLAEEVAVAEPSPSPTRRIGSAARGRAGLAMGRPLWATLVRSPRFRATVDRAVARWRPDIVQAELAVMGQYLSRSWGDRVRRVLVDYDPAPAAFAEYTTPLAGRVRILDGLDARVWGRFQRAVMREADAVVTFTERDRAVLGRWTRRPDAITVIPPGFWVPPVPRDPAGRRPPRVLFVGGFAHPPNADAAERLVTGIFPRVRERVPDCRLQLVGAWPPDQRSAPSGRGVEVMGFVPDLTQLVDDAAVMVMPLRTGGGIRVKVMESLADGKAVVASSRAIEGLAVTHGQEALVAESDEEFADAIVALARDESGRVALARRARSWAERNLAWEQAIRSYGSLYRHLLDPPAKRISR